MNRGPVRLLITVAVAGAATAIIIFVLSRRQAADPKKTADQPAPQTKENASENPFHPAPLPGNGPSITRDPATPDPNAPYDPTEDPNVEMTMRTAIGRPAMRYGPSRAPSAEESREFETVFAELMRTARANDNDGVKRLFDFRRYFQGRTRLWAASRPGRLVPEQKQSIWMLGFHNVLNTRYVNDHPKHRWDQLTVLRVALSADGREALVATRESVPALSSPRVTRWRLAKGESGWRIYDFAESPLWLWHTAAVVDAENGTTKITGGGEADTEVGVLTLVAHLSRGISPKLLEEELANVRGVKLPPTLAAWREFGEGSLRLMQNDPRGAVGPLDTAAESDPVWPWPLIARATAYNRLKEHAKALAEARRAMDFVGPWPAAVVEEVEALRQLGRPDEAVAALRAGLEAFPNDEQLKKLAKPDSGK